MLIEQLFTASGSKLKELLFEPDKLPGLSRNGPLFIWSRVAERTLPPSLIPWARYFSTHFYYYYYYYNYINRLHEVGEITREGETTRGGESR